MTKFRFKYSRHKTLTLKLDPCYLLSTDLNRIHAENNTISM